MADTREVILNPGDFSFGDAGTRMHTLLGSCVSITLWHPTLRVGGMCHYMLPARPGRARPASVRAATVGTATAGSATVGSATVGGGAGGAAATRTAPPRVATTGADGAAVGDPAGVLDGRYADDAVRMFLREVVRHGTRPEEYEAKMFGGGNQFTGANQVAGLDVARENIVAGLWLLDTHGFRLTASQLGGTGPRRVLFDLSTGAVWLNHLSRSGAGEHLPARSGPAVTAGMVNSGGPYAGAPYARTPYAARTGAARTSVVTAVGGGREHGYPGRPR